MSPVYERISSVLGHMWAVCLLIPYSWHIARYQYHVNLRIARFAAVVQADTKKLEIAGKELVRSEKMVAGLDLTTKANKIRSLEMLEITGERIKRDFVQDAEHE